MRAEETGGLAALHPRLLALKPSACNRGLKPTANISVSLREARERLRRAFPVTGKMAKIQARARRPCNAHPQARRLCHSHSHRRSALHPSKSATIAFSSFNSATVASILVRLKALIGTPFVTSHAPSPEVRIGKDEMSPGSTS